MQQINQRKQKTEPEEWRAADGGAGGRGLVTRETGKDHTGHHGRGETLPAHLQPGGAARTTVPISLETWVQQTDSWGHVCSELTLAQGGSGESGPALTPETSRVPRSLSCPCLLSAPASLALGRAGHLTLTPSRHCPPGTA